jgi:hypothetical protein
MAAKYSRVVIRIVFVPTTHASESFPLAISAIDLAASVTPLRRLVGRHELYTDSLFLNDMTIYSCIDMLIEWA